MLFSDKDYRIFYPLSEAINKSRITIDEMRDYIEQGHLILSVRSDDAVGSVGLSRHDAVAFLMSDNPDFVKKIPAYLHRHTDCFEYSFNPSNEPIVIDGYKRNIGVCAKDFESFMLFMGENTKRDVDKTQTRLDGRISNIIKTAKNLKYDLLNIPEGGKAKIKEQCLKDTTLFTCSTFKKAWSKASVEEIISITNKEKYL